MLGCSGRGARRSMPPRGPSPRAFSVRRLSPIAGPRILEGETAHESLHGCDVCMWIGRRKCCSDAAERTRTTNATRTAESCAWPASLDAVAAAPQNHRVLMETDCLRVLDVTVAPGEREPVHAHCWPSVLYMMQQGRWRDYDAEGNLVEEALKAPPASEFLAGPERAPFGGESRFVSPPPAASRAEAVARAPSSA